MAVLAVKWRTVSAIGGLGKLNRRLAPTDWMATEWDTQCISYKRHRLPADLIRQAMWLYFRFTLSLRDVEELLAQREIEVSYDTIRCWTLKFGRLWAHNLRRSRPRSTGRWHLDEMVVKIRGQRMCLWRAVNDEGEVLDVLVQKRRKKALALKLLKKLLKN
jgi:putative transposase